MPAEARLSVRSDNLDEVVANLCRWLSAGGESASWVVADLDEPRRYVQAMSARGSVVFEVGAPRRDGLQVWNTPQVAGFDNLGLKALAVDENLATVLSPANLPSVLHDTFEVCGWLDGRGLELTRDAGDTSSVTFAAPPHEPATPPSKSDPSNWLRRAAAGRVAPTASGKTLDDVPDPIRERVMLAVETWRRVHEYWTARGLTHEPAVLMTDGLRGRPKIFDVVADGQARIERLWGTRTTKSGVLVAQGRPLDAFVYVLGPEFNLFDAMERFAGRLARGELYDLSILERDMGRLEAIGVEGCSESAAEVMAAAGDNWERIPEGLPRKRRLEIAEDLRRRLAAARAPWIDGVEQLILALSRITEIPQV